MTLLVVRAAVPSCGVSPWLLTPNKSHVATIDKLTSFFRLQELGRTGNFRDTEVEFTGGLQISEEIRACGLLRKWDVDALVNERLECIERAAQAYESWLVDETLSHPKTLISKNSFRCEYDADDGRIGFQECWVRLRKPERHIRYLYRVGTLGGWRNPKAEQWISEGRVSHDDIDESDLLDAKGKLRA